MANNEAQWGDAEELLFLKIGDVEEIADSSFADLVRLADAEGLLAPILAGDHAEVMRRSLELLNALAAQLHWDYPLSRIQHAMSCPAIEPADLSGDETSTGL